jgi:hypothetical protein
MFKKLLNSLVGNDNPKPELNPEPKTQSQNEDSQTPEFDVDSENQNEVVYNPETLHGTHYTFEQFDKEIERRAEA